jgi:hypothetical protein
MLFRPKFGLKNSRGVKTPKNRVCKRVLKVIRVWIVGFRPKIELQWPKIQSPNPNFLNDLRTFLKKEKARWCENRCCNKLRCERRVLCLILDLFPFIKNSAKWPKCGNSHTNVHFLFWKYLASFGNISPLLYK